MSKSYFREFGAGVNKFYRTDLDTGKPYRIKSTNDLLSLIDRYDGKANCAMSVYTYTKDDPDPIKRHANIIFDVIAFDFDGDLEEVKEDLNRLRENFLNKLDIEALFVFTGGRGFHVYIYFDSYTPKTHTKRFMKHVQTTITKECGLKTVDPQTFGDTARLFRVPGTRHLKTGLYCIPLTQCELYSKSIDEIKRLASRARPLAVPKHTLKKKNELFLKWMEYTDTKLLGEVIHQRASGKPSKLSTIAKWFKDNKQMCQGLITAFEGAPKGKRDNTLVGLIYYLRMKDLSEEEAYDIISRWAGACEGHINDSDIRYKISYHYRRQRTMPCAYLKKCGYCEGCQFNKDFFRTTPTTRGQ